MKSVLKNIHFSSRILVSVSIRKAFKALIYQKYWKFVFALNIRVEFLVIFALSGHSCSSLRSANESINLIDLYCKYKNKIKRRIII